MSTPRYRDQVKSQEEWDTVLWLQEATRAGLVDCWSYEPRTFTMIPKRIYTEEVQLKTKIKDVERTLHQEATYTPDFRVTLSAEGIRAMMAMFKPALLTSPTSDRVI